MESVVSRPRAGGVHAVFLAAFFSILTITIFGLHAIASVNPFVLDSAEIVEKTDGVTGDIHAVDNSRIVNRIEFHQLDDEVVLKIGIKNNGSEKGIINSAVLDDVSPYVEYVLDDYEDVEVEPGDTAYLYVTSKYKELVSDIQSRKQDVDVKISINYTYDEKEEIIPISVANPSTWDGITLFVLLFFTAASGLIFVAIVRSKDKNAKIKVVAVVLMMGLAFIPSIVKADSGVFDIDVASEFHLNDKLLVEVVDADGEPSYEEIEYGSKIAQLADASKTGYTFHYWTADDENEFDFDAPIIDDIILTPFFTPNTYKVVFNGNGSTEGEMSDQTLVFDIADNLSKNAYKRVGYTFVKWNTQANGDGTDYTDEQSVENLATSGEYQLFAIWSANTDTAYKVTHNLMNVAGDAYITDHTDEYTGTTDTNVTPDTRSYDGFVTPAKKTEKIKGDGSLVIEYNYDRVQFNLTINDGQYVEGAVSDSYNYETPITLTAKDRTDAEFVKWSNGSTDKTISFTMTEDIEIGPVYESECIFGGPNINPVGFCPGTIEAGYLDTGFAPFSEENFSKDFLIQFKLTELSMDRIMNSEGGTYRDTLLSAIYEKDDTNGIGYFPGFSVRLVNNKKIRFTLNNGYRNEGKTYEYEPSDFIGKLIQIRRYSSRGFTKLLIKVGDADWFVGQDITKFKSTFPSTVTFGAAIDLAGSEPVVFRNLVGSMSNISYKFVEGGESFADIMGITTKNNPDFPTLFSIKKECVFGGAGVNVSGSGCEEIGQTDKDYVDTGVRLFSMENYQKDFDVMFEMDKYDPSVMPLQATMFNSKLEDQSLRWPGFTFRRKDQRGDLELSSSTGPSNAGGTEIRANKSSTGVVLVRIMRKDNILCYSLNGGTPIAVHDYTGFSKQFDAPTAWFGATMINNHSDRQFVGQLSNMSIRMGKDTLNELDCHF